MLARRLRRRPNIDLTLVQCLVFARSLQGDIAVIDHGVTGFSWLLARHSDSHWRPAEILWKVLQVSPCRQMQSGLGTQLHRTTVLTNVCLSEL